MDGRDLPEKFQRDAPVIRDDDAIEETEGLPEAGGRLDMEHFSESPGGIPRLPEEGLDLREHLNQLECELIKQALDECNGVVAHAANLLHMRRTTLVEKLRKYGLRSEETSTI